MSRLDRPLHALKQQATDNLARHVLLRWPRLEALFIRLSRTFPTFRPIQWLCFSLSREIAKIPDRHRVVRIPGNVLMELDVSDVYGQIYYFGKVYEPQVTEIIIRCLRSGDTAIDIGANAGYFTLLMAGAVGPMGMVHAFEPNGDLLQTLKRSVRLNGFEKRVVIHQTAVAATGEREVPFHITGKGNTGGSSLAMVREEGRTRNGLVVDVRTVSTISLDEFARRVRLNGCALIKIDVEGAEDLVMQGMSELLRAARPGVIICETRIGSPAHQALIQAGYAVRQVVDWQPETARNGASPVGNVVYSIETDGRA